MGPAAHLAFLLLLTLLQLGLALPARATVVFEGTVGFRQNGFNFSTGGLENAVLDSGEFSYGGALCPAPGTPNFLCGRVRGFAGFEGGRIVMRALSRLKRTNAQPPQTELAAYTDMRVLVGGIAGSPVQTAPGAVFYFGLSGSIIHTKTNANVGTQAQVIANLYAGTTASVQCFGTSCPPKAVVGLRTDDWQVARGFYLTLRTDVAMGNFPEDLGWDAEVSADFADTFELLAIQLLDENDDPIPNVALTIEDADGNPVPIPDTPPDPEATPTASPTPSPGAPTPTPAVPTPTATPGCSGAGCETCDNCVDDDGDTLVDRADGDCTPPANGNGAGLADLASAKALDKCAKAVRKAGAKRAAVQAKQLQACLAAVADCVQLKAGEAGCLGKAQTICTKARAALPAAAATLAGTIAKACAAPGVDATALSAAAGLGFAGEHEACARRGVASLDTPADVAACVGLQHACAAERLLGFTVPRAGELLTLGGWDVAADLPCLAVTSIGGGAGIGAPKQKALRKCDAAIQKGVTKLAAGRAKAIRACAAARFSCVQTKPGDAKCLDTADAKCAQALAALPALASTFTTTVAKTCDAAPLTVADLRAPEGLGFATRDAACLALGTASLATVADLTSCLEHHLACRVDQMLENETPRLDELLPPDPS